MLWAADILFLLLGLTLVGQKDYRRISSTCEVRQLQHRRGDTQMGRSALDQFNQTLMNCTGTINQTFALLNEPATAVEKVSWIGVRKSGEVVSKQATAVGVLWTGKQPGVLAGQENIKAFCDTLQGFLLLCHGSTVGAGPTLHHAIRVSAKRIIDSSLQLLSKAISLSESPDADRKAITPQLAGCVWDACNDLKKTPTTNSTAIGRSLARAAASIKDVSREMQELKEVDVPVQGDMLKSGTGDGAVDGSDAESSASSLDIDDKLSTEEMTIAKSVGGFISSILQVLKELLYIITDISRRLNEDDTIYLYTLESILELCQDIGIQVDDLGACVYPPLELQQMKVATQNIRSSMDGLQTQLKSIEGSSLEGFRVATEDLEHSLNAVKNILDSLDPGTTEET